MKTGTPITFTTQANQLHFGLALVYSVTDEEFAQGIIAQIAALSVQSPDDETTVAAARVAYDGLTDAQKALVTNLATLEAAEKAIADLKSVEPPVEIAYGDVDGNGKVEAADALLVLKNAVGKVQLSDEQFTAADTDGNGKADAIDALNILKKAVNKLDEFPVEE